MSAYCVVYITAPYGGPAKKVAHGLVTRRLAACVNIIPSIHSAYWWKGKLQVGQEAMLILKTRKSLMKKIVAYVTSVHPYELPEIIALPIQAAHKPYLRWIKDETR